MDLNLSEEQKLVQETARDFARKTVMARASEIEEAKAIPKEYGGTSQIQQLIIAREILKEARTAR